MDQGTSGVSHRISAALLAALLFAPFAARPDAAPSETVVSEQICSGLFFVPLEWESRDGEKHELMALFDTGASRSFIDPDAIERISGKRLEVGTRAVMENVSVAGLNFSKFRPRVRELDHLGLALGQEFDVFLQFEAFDKLLLTLDYGKREMRVSKGELPKPDGELVFSTKGRDSRPWIRTRVGSRKRSLLLDSGSNGTISVRPHRSIRWVGQSAKIRLAQGMSDLELNEVGRLDGSIQVGPLEFAEPILSLTTDTELVGYDVLKHFVLTFDQKNRRVRMQPLSDSPVRMVSRTGTGALLRPRGDAVEIARIVPGSSAQEAGLEPGDRVTHVDGVPVAERGCNPVGEQERAVEYRVVRGGQERVVMLEYEVLVE
ncbi:MAG: PDZ domain-containing protein [Woeseiaceae bacterium]|nr:PDZ domain-containing protein [Woeseiaceae bacterium]